MGHHLFVRLLLGNNINQSLGQKAYVDGADPDRTALECGEVRSGSALFAISLRIKKAPSMHMFVVRRFHKRRTNF